MNERRINEFLLFDSFCQILCNDCNVKEICNFHFFGHKCSQCKGYNTNIITTIRPGDENSEMTDTTTQNTEASTQDDNDSEDTDTDIDVD